MNAVVSVENMSDEIMKILNTYADAIDEDIEKITTDVANEARVEVSGTSPTRTGKYAKSWKTKKVVSGRHKAAVVYASNGQYRKTHLLEHGHAQRQGGRAKAIPHIGPAQEHAEDKFMDRLERSIKTNG